MKGLISLIKSMKTERLAGFMIWPLKDGHETGTLFLNFLNMFKEIQIEDLRSSPTEEQAEIWAVPGLMTFLGEHAPTQSEAPWHCVFWHMPSLPMPVSYKLLLSYLSSAILLNTSPISPIDAGILRNSASQASDFLNLYPTARWGSKRRSFGRSRVAIVVGWWHRVCRSLPHSMGDIGI